MGWGGLLSRAQQLSLLGPSGAVVATASPDYGASSGLQANLRISDFTIPTSGVYTLRLTTPVAGKYGMVVSQATPSEAVLGYAVQQGLTTQPSVAALLGTSTFENVFVSMSTDELLGELMRNRIVTSATSVAGLEATLSSDGFNLSTLRPDGLLTALATAPGGSLLVGASGPIAAPAAKTLLQNDFTADKGTFLDVFSTHDLFAQFDNSITTTAGAAIDNLYAFSTYSPQPIPTTAPNTVQGLSLSYDGTTMTTPAAAVAATNALPVGQRFVFTFNFTEVTGYGDGWTPAIGYLDPVNASGQPTITT